MLRLLDLPNNMLWRTCCLELCDECDLVEGLSWLDSLGNLCSKKVIKDFWDVHFSCVMVEGRIVDSNMNGFSGSSFPLLIYYLEVGDVSSGVVVGNVCL